MRTGLGQFLALTVVAIAISACSDDQGVESDGIFDRDGFPFTFEYPEGFMETDAVTVDASFGNPPDAQAGVGLDQNDVLLADVRTLNASVDESNLDEAQAEFDASFRYFAPRATAQRETVAGLPALVYDSIRIPSVNGGKSRFVFILDGDQQYGFNCQSTPEERRAVDEACDLAVDTFELK